MSAPCRIRWQWFWTLRKKSRSWKPALTKRRQEILTILDQMKPEHAIVLSGRFIEGKSTKELGNIMFLSMRQIERRLNDAVGAFQPILNDLIEHETSHGR